MKKTLLNEWHRFNDGHMIEFAGWEMPVQYEAGLKQEHLNTRENAGLFDVSHMGQFGFVGPDALNCLEFLCPTDLSGLEANQAAYSFFANSSGGVVDDLIVYCIKPSEKYFVCVNAANEKNVESHLLENTKKFNVEVKNESSLWGQIALQGPKAANMLKEIVPESAQVNRFGFVKFSYKGADALAARTGYTGEDGFEIFLAQEKLVELWKELFGLGATPVGLGARDTLRLEAAMNLYGNEMNHQSNPYEARLGWCIHLNKGDFLGRAALEKLKEETANRLVGLRVLGRAIPRTGYKVFAGEDEVGIVTSGTFSPSFDYPIGMVRLRKDLAKVGSKLDVQVRARKMEAEVVSLPFYRR